MRTSTRLRAALILAALATTGPAAAQTPLSVIEWLRDNPASEAALPAEPPVSAGAGAPAIDVRPLDTAQAAVGLVPPDVTGLPTDLWLGGDPAALARLIADAPVSGHPALQALTYTLLLAEAQPPSDARAAENLLLARIDKLVALGAVDPAKALIEQAGVTSSPALFDRWAKTALLLGAEDEVCATLAQSPRLTQAYDLAIFCTARRGDLSAATVQFDAAVALDLLPEDTVEPLDRFLHPELYEDADPLPIPRAPSALVFRLYEAVGEALPTAPLPRAFAAADLRDIVGWKAQIDAAERLARTGALSPNTLLGLYTDRLPAASGGVWDRVEALQRFDTALTTRSPDAVGKTLPAAFRQMREAGLDVVFADLFAADLARVALPEGSAARVALRVALLSAEYETLARGLTATTPAETFWLALAAGDPGSATPTDALSGAIAAGFAAPQGDLPRGLSRDRLGEAILRAIALFDQGASGNLADLADAIAIFRALGLETTARRAALQLAIRSEAQAP